MAGPRLAGLAIADRPERWAALGFAVVQDHVELAGVRLELGTSGAGITGWTLHGLCGEGAIDGLPTTRIEVPTVEVESAHPNGAVGVDHVVIITPAFDRTAAALDAAGLALRRTRQDLGRRQGFRRIGPAIMEIVEAKQAPPGPARFWGLTVIVSDLERLRALRARLAPHVSEIRPAVQPGRHIATLSPGAGLSLPVAFMDPDCD